MGYSTNFTGEFNLDRRLDDDTFNLLSGLATTRRMKRESSPEYGIDGEFYFRDDYGDQGSAKVLDHNRPPSTQPSLWCQWVPTKDQTCIGWDGGEKFYEYVDWLQYIIDKILKPRGYVLNGEVEWQGEDRGDCGVIVVKENVIKIGKGRIQYDF